MSKGESLARVGATYVVAVAVGAAWLYSGPDTRWLWLDGLVADLLATVVVFVASRLHHNSSFYDAYWSVLPPLLVGYWWSHHDGDARPLRFWPMFAVVLVWAVRLTANWVVGFPGLPHEDWRYPLLRDRAGRFEVAADLFGIHVVPTIQVFLGLLGAYVVTRAGRGVSWIDAVATLVGLGAVALETVADLQMRHFADTKQPGQVMDRGLWGWSRHPNYFGEFGFWVAIALFGLAAAPQDWWVLAGPVAMLAMFLAASIPMMEERSVERRPEYQRVVERVPRFVPRPPRRSTA